MDFETVTEKGLLVRTLLIQCSNGPKTNSALRGHAGHARPCLMLHWSQQTRRPWADPRSWRSPNVLNPVVRLRYTTTLDQVHVTQENVNGWTANSFPMVCQTPASQLSQPHSSIWLDDNWQDHLGHRPRNRERLSHISVHQTAWLVSTTDWKAHCELEKLSMHHVRTTELIQFYRLMCLQTLAIKLSGDKNGEYLDRCDRTGEHRRGTCEYRSSDFSTVLSAKTPINFKTGIILFAVACLKVH